jgi:hypothetical protein
MSQARLVSCAVAVLVALTGCTSGTGTATPTGSGRTSSSGPASSAGAAAAQASGSASSESPSPSPVAPQWLSGASSDEAADGSYAQWRGSPIEIGGTWDNGNTEQVLMRTICPRGPWAGWDKALDVAVGAIDVDAGESWAAAAKGAYVARWTQNLQKIKTCWGNRDPSHLFIRFAHEMNLPQKWRVRRGEEAAFVTAIGIYSDLRYQIIPEAKIVLCPNDGTDPGLGGLDIRKLWPGKDDQGRWIADVYAVDSYNMSPHITTPQEFQKKINASYPNGVPLGLEKHRQLAETFGVPFAVGEWSNNGDPKAKLGGGESSVYIEQFYAWAKAHAGNLDDVVPGQLLYEVQFNLWNQYAFWPKTIQPKTALTYKSLPWGQ